jgi:hypothetical protein
MRSFFLPDPLDSLCSVTLRRPLGRILLRVINIALAGLLAFVVAGSAACAIRLVLSN